MKRRFFTAASLIGMSVALLAAPTEAPAQSTRQLLDSAKALYEAFQVEAARPIYQRILSPTFTQQVSNLEKAEAYKYLGAAAAILASSKLETSRPGSGSLRLMATDSPERFARVGARFLGSSIAARSVEAVDL